jgi:hypothetical protein
MSILYNCSCFFRDTFAAVFFYKRYYIIISFTYQLHNRGADKLGYSQLAVRLAN